MGSSNLNIFLLVLTLATDSLSIPFRGFSSRSVPGRIRSYTNPDSVKDYLAYYLNTVQHQRNQQQSYGVPDYDERFNQQGYLSRRPHVDPETVAALLPYMSQSNIGGDYSYDYNNGQANTYTDDEGTWYDDAAAPDYLPSTMDSSNNEQAALLQLYLDHIAGKYSLEDLQTLERQAIMEDKAENQLQSLLPQKKSSLPMFDPKATARNIIGYKVRQGQKEEPISVPDSTVRKPIFRRSQSKLQEQKASLPRASTTISSIQNKATKNEHSTQVPHLHKTQVPHLHKYERLLASTTMEPSMKSAYLAFRTYLDQERTHKQKLDETAIHSPQKRFVTDSQSLSQQLASLKKTIT